MALLEAVMDCGFGNWWEFSGQRQWMRGSFSFRFTGFYCWIRRCTLNVRWLIVRETLI